MKANRRNRRRKGGKREGREKERRRRGEGIMSQQEAIRRSQQRVCSFVRLR